MKYLMVAIVCLVSLGLSSAARAADDPTGTWKWTATFNDQTREMKLTLKLEGDKLTGSVPGRDNKETAIENGTFKDGEVSFTITRERNGNKFTSKYNGKLSGDTIKGKIESERDGKTTSAIGKRNAVKTNYANRKNMVTKAGGLALSAFLLMHPISRDKHAALRNCVCGYTDLRRSPSIAFTHGSQLPCIFCSKTIMC